MPLETMVYRKLQKFDTLFLQSEIGRKIDREGEGDIAKPVPSVSGCLPQSEKFPEKLKISPHIGPVERVKCIGNVAWIIVFSYPDRQLFLL